MNSALKLYELSAQFQALEHMGESDEIPAEVLRDTLEGIEGSFDEKCVQVAKFIMALEANAQAIADAAYAMEARGNRVMRRAASIRAYLQFHMQALDKKRIESRELVIVRRANPPAVVVTDEKIVPEKYWVQPPPLAKRIDKGALKTAITAGLTVEGAYVEAGERLEIKA